MALIRQTDRRTGTAHGHRVRVRGRGEVGPKEEAVALRQAQAGRARRPRDRRGRAQQADQGVGPVARLQAGVLQCVLSSCFEQNGTAQFLLNQNTDCAFPCGRAPG